MNVKKAKDNGELGAINFFSEDSVQKMCGKE